MNTNYILNSRLQRSALNLRAATFAGLALLSLCATSFHSQATQVANKSQETNKAQETLSQDNLIYMLTDKGMIVIELADFIAPNHVKQFTALVEEGFYDGLDFYRVIDGFVAQGGDLSEKKASAHNGPLQAEFSRISEPKSEFYPVQSPDLYAEETGFIKGFPAGRDIEAKTEWLLHCPGAVAMARTNDANSGTSDFYIVIGQAPRQLDRNMSVFGQVVYGMEHVQAFSRGKREDGGQISDASQRSKIISARLGKTIPKQEQIVLTRPTVRGDIFQQRLEGGRTLDNPFFHHKGNGNVDVCYYRPMTSVAQN